MNNLISSLTSANKVLKGKMMTYDENFESMERFIERFTQDQPSPSTDQQNQDDDELDD